MVPPEPLLELLLLEELLPPEELLDELLPPEELLDELVSPELLPDELLPEEPEEPAPLELPLLEDEPPDEPPEDEPEPGFSR